MEQTKETNTFATISCLSPKGSHATIESIAISKSNTICRQCTFGRGEMNFFIHSSMKIPSTKASTGIIYVPACIHSPSAKCRPNRTIFPVCPGDRHPALRSRGHPPAGRWDWVAVCPPGDAGLSAGSAGGRNAKCDRDCRIAGGAPFYPAQRPRGDPES